MNIGRREALLGTLCAASLTMLIIPFADDVLRVTLGMLTVFFLPGFAATYAVFPARQLSRTDRMLASLGISLAAAVCTCVLLAALPVGLTRDSLSIALGGGTVLVSAYALFRARSAAVREK